MISLEAAASSPRTAQTPQLYIGTSGWHYPHWQGTFYPERMKRNEWLAYYATQFDCIEINNSFYRLPTAEQVARWAAQTDDSFRFALKAPQSITHRRKLRNCEQIVEQFLQVAGVLDARRGPLLFQLPPRWHANPARLDTFLSLIPPDVRCTVEPRDTSWFCDEVYAVLRERGAALCVYDLAEFEAPHIATADFVYVRLHGPKIAYHGNYHHLTLRRWARDIAQWQRQSKDVYVFFDNDEAAYAPRNARQLLKLCATAPAER
ncbi:MAG: hypothetical protein AMJ69_05615 [Gammaproteobacteria bacterium SG8_47]|nr:MAG: hypothetical protein AMJ69_05615 [Gammaproteobacteria bacterium SG8_47]